MLTKRDPLVFALILIAVVALTVTAMCETAHAQEQSVDILQPCAVAYECVDAITVANATLSWKFSFNPRRAAIYDIVQWTVTRPGQRARQYVAQLAARQKDEHVMRYYRVYEHVRKRNWKRLWLQHTTEWQELQEGSEQFDDAQTALRKLFSFSMALRGGTDPASLTF